jgi:hypothetical protein
MIEWLILTSVKILKTALLTGISLVSSLATGNSDAPKTPCDSVCVVVIHDSSDVSGSIRAVEMVREDVRFRTMGVRESSIPVPTPQPTRAPIPAPTPETELRYRVPPIRVEMTFTPDLLRPPSRDLSL